MSSLTDQKYAPGEHPDLPPPPGSIGVVGWLRHRLFSSVGNTILTILAFFFLYKVGNAVIFWVFTGATFTGDTQDACTQGGACWLVIGDRFHQFMYGLYPQEEYWRANIVFVLMVFAIAPLLFDKLPHRGMFLIFSALFPFAAFYLLSGGWGLETVDTANWGGMLLTLVLGITGIVASLPIGILLALGRRSNMPIVRTLCVCFIEFIRGVPLITILFMASNMLPLFLPEGVNFDKLLRALIGVALFSSAYMAEVIRGGLQAIPKGQYEGADAMGLSYWQSMRLIILPQALRIVIPGIVNTFIGLYKDTTLVSIIGLFDLLGIAQVAVADVKWRGLAPETYAFIALLFFISCFSMSRYSLWLENKLHTGHKR
ncbi:amino acid ABC transporter permease [Kiloniella laminariae]|uniref:Amino acid ABC transporter permease n=1 Tax=Kiloniella laminariae TaxID=454162 RepID=A0ABT4LNH6_9PROT|nr:amino acid ABC transporter permease [Kiloniella laminariae]MCZ4282658.1 amino acid ABC transporter permease [Kiloniella laminariae]